MPPPLHTHTAVLPSSQWCCLSRRFTNRQNFHSLGVSLPSYLAPCRAIALSPTLDKDTPGVLLPLAFWQSDLHHGVIVALGEHTGAVVSQVPTRSSGCSRRSPGKEEYESACDVSFLCVLITVHILTLFTRCVQYTHEYMHIITKGWQGWKMKCWKQTAPSPSLTLSHTHTHLFLCYGSKSLTITFLQFNCQQEFCVLLIRQ